MLMNTDGGGVRGLSSLLILRDLMYAIKRKNNHRDLAKPCNIFDVISGTSTGGQEYIAIYNLIFL
jgi:patatin-like phospholipase/acyl hydrolase